MDIRDFLRPDAATQADLLQGAVANKGILDAHIQAGFSRKEAMELLKTMIAAYLDASVQSDAATAFMERQASGEFNGDN